MKVPFPISYISVFVLVGIVKQIKYNNVLYTLKHWFLIPKKLEFNLSEILFNTSEFYQNLNSKDRIKFEKRVLKFIILKRFVAKEELAFVSNIMKVLIASKAVQLTFGYPYIYLTYLKTIYVYPNKYLSKTNQFYKGETSTKGYLKLSWTHFLEGEINPNDGVNLALHEFTHALHIENHINNDYYLFINPKYLVQLKYAHKELKEEILQYNTPIREYGATNFQEFFAVCVEVFFEKPIELYNYNKELYYLISRILNQDLLKDKV